VTISPWNTRRRLSQEARIERTAAGIAQTDKKDAEIGGNILHYRRVGVLSQPVKKAANSAADRT